MAQNLDDIPLVTAEEAAQNPYPKDARIVIPSGPEGEKMLEMLAEPRRCMDCKHFNWEKGQEEMVRQRIWEQMFREMEHRPEWYGNPKMFGLCDQSGGEMMVHMYAPAKIPRSYADSDTDYYHKDHNVPCPSWTPRNPATYTPYKNKWAKKLDEMKGKV